MGNGNCNRVNHCSQRMLQKAKEYRQIANNSNISEDTKKDFKLLDEIKPFKITTVPLKSDIEAFNAIANIGSKDGKPYLDEKKLKLLKLFDDTQDSRNIRRFSSDETKRLKRYLSYCENNNINNVDHMIRRYIEIIEDSQKMSPKSLDGFLDQEEAKLKANKSDENHSLLGRLFKKNNQTNDTRSNEEGNISNKETGKRRIGIGSLFKRKEVKTDEKTLVSQGEENTSLKNEQVSNTNEKENSHKIVKMSKENWNEMKKGLDESIKMFPHEKFTKIRCKNDSYLLSMEDRERFPIILGPNFDESKLESFKVEINGKKVDNLYKYGNFTFYKSFEKNLPRIYVTETDEDGKVKNDCKYTFDYTSKVIEKCSLFYDDKEQLRKINNNVKDKAINRIYEVNTEFGSDKITKVRTKKGISETTVYELKDDENSSKKP